MIKVWSDRDTTKRTLPVPASLDWSFSDLDKDSGRNDYGLMERERLGSKVKLQLTWNANADKEAHYEMMTLLMNLPPFFYCEYPSPNGGTQQMECYRGDIKDSLYRYDSTNGTFWKETSVNFIER